MVHGGYGSILTGDGKHLEQSEKLDTVLTGMQAAEDLKYIVGRLRERHPACISGLPAAFRRNMSRNMQNSSESTEVTVLSLWQSASRVLACLDDAHTTVRGLTMRTKILPLLFSWEGQRLICSGGEYDGYTVNKIGGVSVDQLYERFQEQFPMSLMPGLVMHLPRASIAATIWLW